MSREIPPMFVVGQAAGEAAAMAVHQRIPPREVNVAQLQDRLRRVGALLGPDTDPAGLAPLTSGATA
jgi:hypothetical protein